MLDDTAVAAAPASVPLDLAATLPLERAAEAHALVERGGPTGRVVLRPGPAT